MATGNRLICGKCGHEADAGFFFCPHCGEKLVIADGAAKSGKKRFSLTRLAGNDAKWYQPAFEAFPSVIAHEYWRLYEFCTQDNPYGALIQVKDVLETVIKFQLLCCAAWAMGNEPPQALRELICEVTSPRMALGTWCDFGVAFERVLKSEPNFALPQMLSQPLAETLRQYNARQIVSWRNNMIGHGALGFSEDKEFQQDIEDKIDLLAKLFGKIGPQLTQQKLMAGDQVLMGHALARRLPECRDMFVQLRDEEPFSVDPYIRMMEDAPPEKAQKTAGSVTYGIYFYDNQNDRLRRSELLSYPSGKRKHAQIGMFLEMSEARVKRSMVNAARAVDDRYKTQDDDAMIDKLLLDRLEQEFVEPDMLMDWLRGELSARDRGILLLQMPRGTGKSTFAEKLNGLNKKPLEVDPLLDVRTYHISRAQLMSADDFEATLEAMWERSYNDSTRWSASAMPRMSRMIRDGMTPGQALTALLNECVRFTRNQRGKRRILMVLDGLDEIVDDSLWAYMDVDAQALESGAYLLFTARTMHDMRVDKNVSPDVLRRVETLAYTSQMSLEHTGKAYRTFLRKYLDAAVETELPEDEKEDLMRRADYRVLYLGMLCKLLNAGLSAREVRDKDQLVWMYLRVLTACYGEKEAEHLRELLAVLCTFGKYEPLSLQEIAELTWNRGVVTIDLLGKMNDIAPLLKAQRGFFVNGQIFSGVTRYSLANPDLIAAFKRRLGNTDDIVSEKAEQAVAYICENPTEIFRQPENASFTQAMELVASLLFKVMQRKDAIRMLDRYEDWAERFVAYTDGLRYDADAIAYNRVEQMVLEPAVYCDDARRLEKAAPLLLAAANLDVQLGRRNHAHIRAGITSSMLTNEAEVKPWQMEPDRLARYIDAAQFMLEGYNSLDAFEQFCTESKVRKGNAQAWRLFAQGREACRRLWVKSDMLLARLEMCNQDGETFLFNSSHYAAFAILGRAARTLNQGEERDEQLLCMLHELAGDLLMMFGRRPAAIREYQWAQEVLAHAPKTGMTRAKGLSIEEKLMQAEDLDASINRYEELDRFGNLVDRTRLIRAYMAKLQSLYEKRRLDAEICKPLVEKTEKLLSQLSVDGGLADMEKADVLLLTARARLKQGEQTPQINDKLKKAADVYEAKCYIANERDVIDTRSFRRFRDCCRLGLSWEKRTDHRDEETGWKARGKRIKSWKKWLGLSRNRMAFLVPWLLCLAISPEIRFPWLAPLEEAVAQIQDTLNISWARATFYALFRVSPDQRLLMLLKHFMVGGIGLAFLGLWIALETTAEFRQQMNLRWWLRERSVYATRFKYRGGFFMRAWTAAWALPLLIISVLSRLGIAPEVMWGSSFLPLGAAAVLWWSGTVGTTIWMRRSVCGVLHRRFRKWARRCERKRPSDRQRKNRAEIHDSDNGRKERGSHK